MSDHSTDRNLLFGLLALQNSFVDQDDLLAAFREWTQDKSRSIEDVLRKRKTIGEAECGLLSGLVRKHIERHGGSPERSLAALSSIGPVAASLRQFDDHAINASLGHVGRGRAAEPDPYATRPPTAEEQTMGPGVRFKRLRPHAKGGLGEVFVALDKELNREVALKEIQDHYADNLDSRTRFVIEAEITGGLEHPGIVPVYGLGQYADGRPFYAMRFIQGDSLADAIRRFHGLEGAAVMLGERILTLQKLLRRFLDVCNAMAYAHSRSVLHRDLKPGNIMVGKYGETLIVDWGLAKSVDHADPVATEGERPLIPASGSGSAPTLAGSAIGTPEYMSPEQAVGDLAHLGPATDVYSLGATLYCLLTGKSPFERRADEAGQIGPVLNRVSKGDFSPPRKLDVTIPAPLDAICLKAMSLRPIDRYSTPRALADDIERWLADEPVSAFHESWTGRLKRWARRHKAWTQAGAVALVLVAVVSTVAVFLVDSSRRNVANALSKERAARAEADSNFQMARAAVDDYLTKVSENTLLKQQDRADLRALRRELLETALKYYNQFIEKHANDFKLQSEQAYAYFRVAKIIDEVGSKAEALKAYEKSADILARLAVNEPAIAEYRERLAVSHNRIALVQSAIGRIDDAMKSHRVALTILDRLTADDPNEVAYRKQIAVNHQNMAMIHSATAHHAEALREDETALASYENLAANNPNDATSRSSLAFSYNNIAATYSATGRNDEALKMNDKALAIMERLVTENPSVAEYRASLATTNNNIALLLLATGRISEAKQIFEKTLAIRERLVAENPSVNSYRKDLTVSHQNLAILLSATSRNDEAIKAQHRALAILENLVTENPSVTEYRNDLAFSYNKIALLSSAAGRSTEALQSINKSLGIFERLATENPNVADYQNNIAASHFAIANMLVGSGRHDEAKKSFQQTISIRERLVGENPNVPEYRSNLAGSYNNFANLLAANGRNDEALKAFEKALVIHERLAAEIPTVPLYRNDLATSRNNIAILLSAGRRTDEAIRSLEKAIVIFERLVTENPSVTAYRNGLSGSYNNMANQLSTTGRRDEAMKTHEKAITLRERLVAENPAIPEYRSELAISYLNMGRLANSTGVPEKAIPSLEKAQAFFKQLATENPEIPRYQQLLKIASDSISDMKKAKSKSE